MLFFYSGGMRCKAFDSQVSQRKVRKPHTFTPIIVILTRIFQRLCAKRLLKPVEGWILKNSSSTFEGWILKNSSSNFDLSMYFTYHSNIQGH